MLKIDISHKINQRNIEIHINDDAPKIYAIQGPSGIGKTTILNMIAGLKKANQAEIEVNTAETNVSYTKITAPMDGTIISVPVSEGQTVNANQTTPTIVTIADLSQMKV